MWSNCQPILEGSRGGHRTPCGRVARNRGTWRRGADLHDLQKRWHILSNNIEFISGKIKRCKICVYVYKKQQNCNSATDYDDQTTPLGLPRCQAGTSRLHQQTQNLKPQTPGLPAIGSAALALRVHVGGVHSGTRTRAHRE